MPFSTDPDYRAQFITGFLALADYLAGNPAIPVPDYGDSICVFADPAEDGGTDQVRQIAALLGGSLHDELASGGHFKTGRSFGPLRYQVISIPQTAMAQHNALMSYRDSVTP
jgi:hypothetical protein